MTDEKMMERGVGLVCALVISILVVSWVPEKWYGMVLCLAGSVLWAAGSLIEYLPPDGDDDV